MLTAVIVWKEINVGTCLGDSKEIPLGKDSASKITVTVQREWNKELFKNSKNKQGYIPKLLSGTTKTVLAKLFALTYHDQPTVVLEVSGHHLKSAIFTHVQL